MARRRLLAPWRVPLPLLALGVLAGACRARLPVDRPSQGSVPSAASPAAPARPAEAAPLHVEYYQISDG